MRRSAGNGDRRPAVRDVVKTKSVYDPVEESDGQRILVARFWPRGLSKERLSLAAWNRDVAPSAELVRDWKAQDIDWKTYESRYRKEIRTRKPGIMDLVERARAGTITLLCYEQEDDPHCHRHLLKRMIESQLSHRPRSS
jgi:uncharacterized protein YeaO (DUF488 family)